jgi:integrase
MSSIMRSAVTDDIVEKSPCQVRGASVERAPERPVATMAEVEAMAELMPEDLRIAVVLAAWCQLRRGEVRGSRRMDVDLGHGLVTIDVTRTTAMSGRSHCHRDRSVAECRLVGCQVGHREE